MMSPIVATWLTINGAGIIATLALSYDIIPELHIARTSGEHDELSPIAHGHVRDVVLREAIMLAALIAGIAVWRQDPKHPSLLLTELFIWGLMATPILLTVKSLWDLRQRRQQRRRKANEGEKPDAG